MREANLDLVVEAGMLSEVVHDGLLALEERLVMSVLQQVPSQDTPELRLDRDWEQ